MRPAVLQARHAAALSVRLQGVLAFALCFLLFVVSGFAAEKERVMSDHATGTFEVKIVPEAVTGKAGDPALQQFSIDKTFHGDLEGTSLGSMLSTGSPAKGTAAYVAMESVRGTLKGRAGGFVLTHVATMIDGDGKMTVTIAPGSGSGALSGIAGTFAIRIEGGKHYYDLDYTLPQTAQ